MSLIIYLLKLINYLPSIRENGQLYVAEYRRSFQQEIESHPEILPSYIWKIYVGEKYIETGN